MTLNMGDRGFADNKERSRLKLRNIDRRSRYFYSVIRVSAAIPRFKLINILPIQGYSKSAQMTNIGCRNNYFCYLISQLLCLSGENDISI